MHDVISFLKDIPSRTAASGISACYVSKDGSVYAGNNVLQAGIEYDLGADFAASADAVDAALGRMNQVSSIDIGEKTIVLKSGRLRSEIRIIDPDSFPVRPAPEEWIGSPAGLSAVLDVARKFVGDRVWTAGIRLWRDRVTACNPAQAIVDMTVPGLALDRPYLLPVEAAAFLVAQGDPYEIGPAGNGISFRWQDGRWMTSKLLDFEMPEETFERLFGEKLGDDAPVIITDDWRSSLADAEALGDGSLRLTAEGLRAKKDNITTDVNVGVDIPTDHSSTWSTKGLVLMSAIADRWNPLSHPNPALFIGKNIRGAVVATAE